MCSLNFSNISTISLHTWPNAIHQRLMLPQHSFQITYLHNVQWLMENGICQLIYLLQQCLSLRLPSNNDKLIRQRGTEQRNGLLHNTLLHIILLFQNPPNPKFLLASFYYSIYKARGFSTRESISCCVTIAGPSVVIIMHAWYLSSLIFCM